MANITSHHDLPPLPAYTLRPLPSLIPGFPDTILSMLLPIIAYWGVSMIFHVIDEWDLFPQYRLHTPAEVLKRNHVSRWDVFKDVIIQQVIQTVVGLALTCLDEEATVGREEYDIAKWAQKIRMAQRAIPIVLATVGVNSASLAKNIGASHAILAGALSGGVYPQLSQTISESGSMIVVAGFAEWELVAAKMIYHVAVPALQFFLAVMIVDTWQYFLHRAMHMNKWLYTTFHSRHHRLYVPYAYGALYNHPFEGFLLDTLGTGLAYLATGMTVRQAMWFFTLSTIKTVDDHCGYKFPWDPLQHITSNNAGYHDVHHQSWGIKTNFSQPFFTFWDGLLGTKWTGGDVSARYERAKLAAQKALDNESAAITGSDKKSNSSSRAPYNENVRPSAAIQSAQPSVPLGKASQQAHESREQVLEDVQGGGGRVLAEETAEENNVQSKMRQSTRARATNARLKDLVGRVEGSFYGKSSGVLGVESGRR